VFVCTNNSGFFLLQELLDETGNQFTGKLLCVGSHTSALRKMTAGSEPLYGRGFDTIIITPTSPSTLCQLLTKVLYCVCSARGMCSVEV